MRCNTKWRSRLGTKRPPSSPSTSRSSAIGAFTNKVRGWIVDDRLTAQAALHRLLDEYTVLFAKTNDEYLRERLNDVRDVVVRLTAHLSHAASARRRRRLQGPLIVVADELLPSQVVALGDVEVRGIVTQAGSHTSHAAILARSRGIPAVSGVRGILRQVKTGDTLVVDGRDGHVLVNPDPEQRSAYLQAAARVRSPQGPAGRQPRPAGRARPTACALELLANINNVADAQGGRGDGRQRASACSAPSTVSHASRRARRRGAVRRLSRGHRRQPRTGTVTIRTLDLGGDKTVPYLGHTHRKPIRSWAGAASACRSSIPSSSPRRLRAILRAAADAEQHGGRVRMMFPMITTLEEMRKVRAMVRQALRSNCATRASRAPKCRSA